MLVKVVLQGIPTTSDANHHMVSQNISKVKNPISISRNFLYKKNQIELRQKTYPHKDENPGISNPVFALGHSNHGKLSGTLTFRHQFSDLQKIMRKF
jgi:hypothetical protein